MSAKPPDRERAIGNVASFLKSANTVTRKVAAELTEEDPLIAVLRGLAEGPRSLPHLVKQTGLGPSELGPLVEKLESMRMVQRQEEAGRYVFSIEPEGIAMLEAAS